jgi:universal stress protein E
MIAFNNILAGINLSWGRRLALAELNPIAQEVSRCATWLARKTAARLTFVSALNITPKALKQPSAAGGTVEEAAQRVLENLVRTAREAGVDARSALMLGAGPTELLQRVQDDDHDLLLIGTRDLHGIRRLLFGCTAARLIHQCPCPVWVAKPRSESQVSSWNILVASDLGSAAQHALALVVPLAQALGARVHVLHMVDFPSDHFWATVESDPRTIAYHRRLRGEAEQELRHQVEQTGCKSLGVDVQVHVKDMAGLPDVDVLKFIEAHHIDVLALGMQGHSGLEGFLVGNTAERMLPDVPCSLLAVRGARASVTSHAGA